MIDILQQDTSIKMNTSLKSDELRIWIKREKLDQIKYAIRPKYDKPYRIENQQINNSGNQNTVVS